MSSVASFRLLCLAFRFRIFVGQYTAAVQYTD